MIVRRILLALILLAIVVGGATSCVTQPWVRPARSPDIPVDVPALQRHVHELAVTYAPRSVDDPAKLEAAGDYVLAAMNSAGAKAQVQYVEADGVRHRNFIASFGPADGPLLVVGAHYDACGTTPGADDNASGVAALLELTRLLAAQPPAHPVQLVAYTLEEPPYFRTDSMGSFQHARDLHEHGREVRLMLALEMIGFYRDGKHSQSYPLPEVGWLYPGEGNFIAVVGGYRDFGAMRRVKALFLGASDLPVETINAPAFVQGIDFSDHASYWHFDMPAFMVTDTAFLRNPNYHDLGDTPETLDYARMAKVVRAVHAVVMQF